MTLFFGKFDPRTLLAYSSSRVVAPRPRGDDERWSLWAACRAGMELGRSLSPLPFPASAPSLTSEVCVAHALFVRRQQHASLVSVLRQEGGS
jgi:hypothetical protein